MDTKKILSAIVAGTMALSAMSFTAMADTETVADFPTATVTKIENDDLTFALNFKADKVTEAQLDYYGDWYADFVLTVNKDVTFNADGEADGYLSGQYDAWSENWVNVPFEDVTLKAGESLKIMEYAAELMNQSGLKLTYADVYNGVKDFDCGVFFEEEFLAANPDLEVTLELRMYNPANESESHTVGETYEFTLPVTEFPKAEVSNVIPFTLTADDHNYMVWPSGDSSINRPLDVVMNFKALETLEEAANGAYGDWIVDFYLTVDGLVGESITAADCYLAGNYGEFGWIVIPTDGLEIEGGVTYPVVSAYDANLTYENICDYVKDFTAAIHIDEDILEANPDMTVSLALKMRDPSKENYFLQIGETATYTAEQLRNNASANNFIYGVHEGTGIYEDQRATSVISEITAGETTIVNPTWNLTVEDDALSATANTTISGEGTVAYGLVVPYEIDSVANMMIAFE